MEVIGKESNNFHSFLITLGGPLQTIITGTVGFFLILNRRKTNRFDDLDLTDWSFIFLSFFLVETSI